MSLIAIFMLLVIYMIVSLWWIYHTVIRLQQNVEKARANIEVLLLQRSELIPELVKIDQYIAMESLDKTTLEKLVTLNESINHRIDFYNQSAEIFNACFDAFPHSYCVKLLSMKRMKTFRKIV